MKNLFLFLTLLFAYITTYAQTKSNWCATDEMLQEYFESNPGAEQDFFEKTIDIMSTPPAKGRLNNKTPIYTIPVVVHVIHYNGIGNITKAQIDDGIRILNEDFNKLNADTANVRSIFSPYISNAQVEFKLAKIDPNGNCTEGINRINSFLTFDSRNETKALSYWDANKYFNVWIVNTIRSSGSGGGNVLGFAQFPNSGPLTTYGIVVRADEWGSIGQAATKDGRTVTHEVGHCFGLFHTFQSACGSFCNTSGDFVCDTPPQFDDNNNSCNFSLNTCSNDASGGNTQNPNPYTTNVPDQLENYMGYGLSCLGMFTEGQKDRMHAVLNQTSNLISLTSNSNLIATGTNPGYVAQTCPPKADAFFPEQLICVGGQLSFTESSYNGPVTTYDWEFPGASPSSSTSATPTVTYTTPGVHDVILRVSNSVGADTIVIPNIVYAGDTNAGANGFNYFNGFESAADFNNWIVISPSGNPQWTRVAGGISFSGVGSAYLNNNINGENETEQLISPPIDLTQVIAPTFKFRIAYKQTSSLSSDNMKCQISIDCGQTWTTRGILNSSTGATGMSTGIQSSNFIPSSPNDWKEFTISTTAAMRSSKNAMFRFDFTSGGGNNVFIDDFRVDGNPVGIADAKSSKEVFTIFPNPSRGENVTVQFQLNKPSANANLYITNLVGKKVMKIFNGAIGIDPYKFNIATQTLSSGIYFITLDSENGRITKKLVVN